MDALKSLIRERLRGHPQVARLLEARPELVEEPKKLLETLEELGVVEEIYGYLDSSLQKPEEARAPVAETALAAREEPSQKDLSWQLRLRLVEGQAFLDYLDDAEGKELCFHLAFGSQRLRSRRVAASCAPRFEEVLQVKLPGSSRSSMLHQPPLHLVLVCYQDDEPWDSGPGTLLSSHHLEWRHCLALAGPMKITVELQGVGRRRQLSVGVLHAEVELLPAGEALPRPAIAAQLKAEEQQRAEVMRRCFEEMDRWWMEHHQLYPSRNIRIFAQTENSLFLPVSSFVAPLHGGRHLDGPGHALRFVSLLPVETGSSQEPEPRWHSFPAMWAKGRLSGEEKALLLCSLLLGYSLDAWCCLGTDDQGKAHAWVLVRQRGDASSPHQVACWDPRTARVGAANFRSMDTIFNHRRILVCHQEELAKVSYDFGDPRCWLAAPVDEEVLEVLRMYPSRICPGFADLALTSSPRSWNCESVEELIEDRLMASIRSHREALNLTTVTDLHLAQLLHVALVSLESERRGNAPQKSFEELAARICTAGEVLRATPVQFNHLKISLFWAALSQRAAVKEILAQGRCCFAVRCRVVLQPESAVAVWVLLAAKAKVSGK